jgi:hypothetical protein
MAQQPDPLTKPRPGERATRIRNIASRYPKLSRSAIARMVGCDPSNVTQVLKTTLKGHSDAELRDFQTNKPDIMDALNLRVVGSITDTKLRKTSAAQLVTMSAILTDKTQLLRGQATSININVLFDVLEAIRQRDQPHKYEAEESSS